MKPTDTHHFYEHVINPFCTQRDKKTFVTFFLQLIQKSHTLAGDEDENAPPGMAP